ncbi:MAG: hypothetical protein WCF24_08190 [Acidimicrobiales bacterium]
MVIALGEQASQASPSVDAEGKPTVDAEGKKVEYLALLRDHERMRPLSLLIVRRRIPGAPERIDGPRKWGVVITGPNDMWRKLRDADVGDVRQPDFYLYTGGVSVTR